MAEKIGRRGLFGAIAGLVVGVPAAVVPCRESIQVPIKGALADIERAYAEHKRSGLQDPAHGAVVELRANGDVILRGPVCVGGRDMRTAQPIGKLKPGDTALHSLGVAALPYPRAT